MNWEQLVGTNNGENAVADIQDLVYLFIQYLDRRGATLAIKPARLVKQILKYILLRQKCSIYDISAPQSHAPNGWSLEDEEIWNDWIVDQCCLESWEDEVVTPIFGGDMRLYEVRCEGWRLELVHFFPWWIQRSFAIVDKYNPSQMESDEEDNKVVDSYIMDHGSAKQKRAALR
jgi:hypothetical protein